jgi:hypothetical protein
MLVVYRGAVGVELAQHVYEAHLYACTVQLG